MTSRKRSARQRERDEFRSSLEAGDLGDLFAREEQFRDELEERRDDARRLRACESKNRYASRAEAEEAKAWSEAHGARGLAIYRCEWCRGWHLTSHPWE